MTRSADVPPLAAEFPPATRADWQRAVAAVLKDASLDRLRSRTADGFVIEPIYERRADALPLAGRRAGAAWQVVQRIELPDPAAANAEAHHERDNGAGGLVLAFAGAIGAYGYGLPADADALARALEGMVPERGFVFDLDLSSSARAAPLQFADWVERQGIAPAGVDMRCGLDPLRSLAVEGASPLAWPELATLLAQIVRDLTGRGFAGPFVVGDARPVHNAGGSEAQELAYALAAAIAYLRALEGAGFDLDAARRLIFFRFAADADLLLTVAKLRALRKLWASVEAACGLMPRPTFIATETAWRMLARRDPHVNLLRTTLAAAAAGLGGADAVTVLPFTAALGLPDRFARRMARNIQLLLREEANLARVTDPAAGSGAIEALTDALCHAAWHLLQEIEAAGGLCAALQAGLIQRQVAAARSAREAAVATRQQPLIGASEFPVLAEAPVAVLACEPVPVAPHSVIAMRAEPLPCIRLAVPFERLREAADRRAEETGRRPCIFLAALGPMADFTPRLNFARNFFAAGGVESVGGEEESESLATLVAAFRGSHARLACLCGSDATYAREAAAAVRLLREAGAIHVFLAGRPPGLESALREAGVGTFIAAGCDALAILGEVHALLGLAGQAGAAQGASP